MNVSSKVTRDNYYTIPFVSASSLHWFGDSPKFFRMKQYKLLEEETASYMELGKQIHMKILEPKEFDKNYTHLTYNIPSSEKQKEFCNSYLTNKGKATERILSAYKSTYSTSGMSDKKIEENAVELKKKLASYIKYLQKSTVYKDVLTKNKWGVINDAKKAVETHKKANNLLFRFKDINTELTSVLNENEYPIHWKFKSIDCKSLLDRLVIDHDNKLIQLIDVKTTFSLAKFTESYETLKIYRQLAFYWLAVGYLLKNNNYNIEDYKKETYIVAAQTKPPIQCRVFDIQESSLSKGLDEINNILPAIEWHTINNKWDYSQDYYKGTHVEYIY